MLQQLIRQKMTRLKLNGPNKHFAFVGVLGLTFAALLLTNVKSQEEAVNAGPGLRGILPELVPEDLLDEKFEALGGNWEEWGQETASLAASLYEGEDLDSTKQREVIEELDSRLRVMKRALEDSRYRSIHTELNTFYGRLSRRVDLAAAILDTLEADPVESRKSQLEKLQESIVAAVAALDDELGKIPNGRAWLPYVQADELKQLAADKADAETALPVYQAVIAKLASRDSLEDEAQKEFLSKPGFVNLQAELEAYVQRQQAPMLDLDNVRTSLTNLVKAIEAYESGAEAVHAAAIRDAYRNLSDTMTDGGEAVAEVLRQHYLNYNLKIAASEGFLNRFVRETRNRSGQVRDQLAGANIYGNSTTNATTEVDIVPSQNGARLEMVVNGTTQSNTAGVTSQATVYTQGYHRFTGRKAITFDGNTLFTQPATINVQASNRTTGVSPSYDWIPLIGSYARGQARSVAASRRGQGEAMARQRITDQVLPELNSNVEKAVTDANERLEAGLRTRLRGLNLEPKYNFANSSSQHAFLNSQVLSETEISGGGPNIVNIPANGVVFSLHESLLNNMVDRMNFAGRTMTDDEIREEIEKFLTALTGNPVSLSEKTEGESKEEYEESEDDNARSFIFADKDPVRFRLADGLIYLILRAGFERQDQDPISPKLITIPLEYSVSGDKIVVKRGVVEVAPLPGADYSRAALLTRGVIRKKIERSLPDRERSRAIRIERSNGNAMIVNITKFSSVNGWLTIEAN